MVVMILERVPPALRGELTRWLIEPHTGVFIGHVSALVRERLWTKCLFAKDIGGVIQAWSTNNEQRFAIRMIGHTQRRLRDFEGVVLACVPNPSKPLSKKPNAEVALGPQTET